jgi:hypothetical protein
VQRSGIDDKEAADIEQIKTLTARGLVKLLNTLKKCVPTFERTIPTWNKV